MILPLLPSPTSVKPINGYSRATGEPLELSDASITCEEGYRLHIEKEAVTIRAGAPAGFYWARQTLRQLRQLFPEQLPCCRIDDEPAFTHRGFMIDCVRHFFPVSDLKKMIEAASLFKFNIFHWHLTDDQGWRIPIDRYPRLAAVGAKRPFSNFGRDVDKTPCEGLYTKEEIRDVVEFCRKRHMEVIPEVEMPGHVSALLSAYPECSCTGEPVEVKTRGGVYKEVLCAGNPQVTEMMENILLEVMELFPGEKLHIGGDEAPKDRWRACPRCQAKMNEEHLETEAQLQGYFTNHIAAFLKAHGKTAVVWNDALKGGNLSDDIEVQYWIGDMAPTEAHVNGGGHMVMSDYYHYYLDYSYGQTPPGKIASYDPIPAGVAPQAKQNFAGVEAPIWTEYIKTLNDMGVMCWPRMAAVAQTGWSRDPLSEEEFLKRARLLMPLVHALGIPSAPEKLWKMKKAGRIADALKFWYHAMTWGDFRAFIAQLKRERQELKENAGEPGTTSNR